MPGLLFALEGPDGSGKSSLAETLTDLLEHNEIRSTTVHFGPPVFNADLDTTPSQQALDELFNHKDVKTFSDREDDELIPKHALILDRFHMGCAVYGPIYRPDQDTGQAGDMTYDDYGVADHWIRRNGGRTHVIMPPLELITIRLQRDGDDFVDPDDEDTLRDIVARYATVSSTTSSAEIIPATVTLEERQFMALYAFSSAMMRRMSRRARVVTSG